MFSSISVRDREWKGMTFQSTFFAIGTGKDQLKYGISGDYKNNPKKLEELEKAFLEGRLDPINAFEGRKFVNEDGTTWGGKGTTFVQIRVPDNIMKIARALSEKGLDIIAERKFREEEGIVLEEQADPIQQAIDDEAAKIRAKIEARKKAHAEAMAKKEGAEPPVVKADEDKAPIITN